jgi:hypothetical protein
MGLVCSLERSADRILMKKRTAKKPSPRRATPLFEREHRAFRRAWPQLAAHQGKYVVIFGDRVLGVYEDLDTALEKGYEEFGDSHFMVNPIDPPGTVYVQAGYHRLG